MHIRPSALRTVLAVATLWASTANAGYFSWDPVELPASSGASCGDGSPYRFFVNRTPFTTNTVVIYEGGGACWAQNSCLGKNGLGKSASNPNGIARDYMSRLTPSQPNNANSPLGEINLSFYGLITPFSTRVNPIQSVKTQSWNIVYVPYCTGDVHTGNSLQIYDDAEPMAPRVQHHRGYRNSKGVTDWIAANLPRPDRLLVTGFSAGGVGSQAAYPYIREKLNPKRSALLADSGPLMWAPSNGDPSQFPSVPLHNKVRVAWGYDGPEGIVTELVKKYPGQGSANNLGSLLPAIAKLFPNDRFSMAVFQRDVVFSGFAYESFFPEIANEPDVAKRSEMLLTRWNLDLRTTNEALKNTANIGWYMPYGRDLVGSHCLSTFTFKGTAIKEAGIDDLNVVVDDLISGSGAPIRQYEKAKVMQSPTGISALDDIINMFFDRLL